jgi:hypothetical protein
MRNAYKNLVGKPKGGRPSGRSRRVWEDNIRMDLKEIGWKYLGWMDVAHDKEKWRAFVNTVMDL